MRYIAQFQTANQISPDDWAGSTPTLLVEDHTTIGEIREWYRKIHTVGEMEVKVIEVAHLED